MSSFEDAVKSLPQLLEERLKAIEEREKDVDRREAVLTRALGGATDSDVIELNVGGSTKIAVLRRTLTSVEGSMLEAMFSGRWDDSLTRDSDENVFIDQDPELFLTLINYLRNKGCETEDAPALPCPTLTPHFYRLVAYYGVTFAVYPIEVVKRCGYAETCQIENFPPTCSVSTSELVSFDLCTVGHLSKVRSFVAVLGECTKLLVGWRHVSHISESSGRHDRGVGYFRYSMSFDCLGKRLVKTGATRTTWEVVSIVIGEGTTVRCTKADQNGSFRWTIGDATVTAPSTHFSPDSMVPSFSLQGSAHITNVQYETA